ncbi:MAG: hypothetical protein KIT33_10005 [Candidatus Kapabacteria bacterium]|nr:hypothetical protein [Ignavibacteriota bacterium]MCW5885291.1 hypothetical protein [Candidatus Kapabacteria bacterium]
MIERKVKYYHVTSDPIAIERKIRLTKALVPVMKQKMQAPLKNLGLAFKINHLNILAKKIEINRLTALLRHYLDL